jgi:hypothetical protein
MPPKVAAGHAPELGPGSPGRRMGKSLSVRFSGYSFGSVRVDGVTYDHDLIIDRGKIRKRKKALPASSAAPTAIPRCRPRRISPGGAAGW